MLIVRIVGGLFSLRGSKVLITDLRIKHGCHYARLGKSVATNPIEFITKVAWFSDVYSGNSDLVRARSACADVVRMQWQRLVEPD